jgi:hypothetical protein
MEIRTDAAGLKQTELARMHLVRSLAVDRVHIEIQDKRLDFLRIKTSVLNRLQHVNVVDGVTHT